LQTYQHADANSRHVEPIKEVVDLIKSWVRLPCAAQFLPQLLHSQSHGWDYIIVPQLDHFNHLREGDLVALIRDFREVSHVSERLQIPIPHLDEQSKRQFQNSRFQM
jgi:hypothetical protein